MDITLKNVILTIVVLAIVILVGLYIKYILFGSKSDKLDRMKGAKVSLVNYYATWCGYSKQFLPIWKRFTSQCQSELPDVIIKEEICEDANEEACSKKGVQGYPTVILYIGDQAITYEGKRTAEDLMAFLKKHL